MKLYTYQKELLHSAGKRVYINWCRGAGLTTALAYYILENKPKNIYMNTTENQISTLINLLTDLKNEYKIQVEDDLSLSEISITFLNTGQQLRIYEKYEENKTYDLLISTSPCLFYKNQQLDVLDIKSYTHFVLFKGNVSTVRKDEHYDTTSLVDYKEALKAGQLSIEHIVDCARDYRNIFYKEFAILDKPKKEEMSYETFAKEALQRLQKQFLEIPTNKDTVLTRKNIIEMIKDIKQMEKQ